MDAVRDLGRVEPWQESLERSRARRSESIRAPVKRAERPRDRRRAQRTAGRRRSAPVRRAGHSRLLVVAGVALALPVAVLSTGLPGGGHASPPPSLASSAYPNPADSGGPLPSSHSGAINGRAAPVASKCQPTASGGSGYVNPLSGARVRSERIDQGVDYAGAGTVAALGAATVTYVATAATGWPGSFIEYRLLDGNDAGCYVYYAEGVKPVAGLHVGQTMAAGQTMASVMRGWPTGIEIGWGAGTSTMTYAAKTHQWSATSDQENVATAAGKSFSTMIASLGGPPGKAEG